MARFQRAEISHTEWCTRDHTCGFAEHRGRPVTISPDTGGRAVVTRVRADDRDYAEITVRVPLHRSDRFAGWVIDPEGVLALESRLSLVAITPVQP